MFEFIKTIFNKKSIDDIEKNMARVDLSNEVCAIVGLGNPGNEYQNTRHNIGFMIVDNFLEDLSGNIKQVSGCHGICFSKQYLGRKMFFLKPLTYMNLSGQSVAALCKKQKLNPKQVLIVFDDMDLPLGKIRLRQNGGSGGHNGIKSIISELGTENFPRLRVGIGRSNSGDSIDHVLSEFSNEDENILTKLLEISKNAIKLSVRRGVSVAMNEYNGHEIITTENV